VENFGTNKGRIYHMTLLERAKGPP